MIRENCNWCGEPNPEETLAISPVVNIFSIIDALTEAAAEQPRNDQFVNAYEMRAIDGGEPEMAGLKVQRDAVLTLGEARKAIKQIDLDGLLRSDVKMPVCSRCAESISNVSAE